VALFLMAISLFISKVILGSRLAPLGVYSLLWTSIIVVYFSNIFKYPALSGSALIMIFGSYVSFIIGSVAGGVIGGNGGVIYGKRIQYKKLPVTDVISANEFSRLQIALSIFSILGLVLSIIYFIVVVSNVGVSVFFSQFFEHTVLVRKSMIDDAVNAGRTGFITMFPLIFIYGSCVLLGQYLAFDRGAIKYLVLVLLSVLIYSTAEMSRARILDVIALIVVSYYLFSSSYFTYAKRRGFKLTNSQKIILFSVISIIGLIIIGSVQNKHDGELELTNVPLNPVITHGLYRLSIGFAMFDNLAHIYEGTYYLGDATLNVFMRILSAVNIINEYNRVVFYEVNPVSGWIGYNTPTYLMWIFVDFGMLGVVVFPLLFGFIFSSLYIKVRMSPNFFNIAILALLYLSIFVSFGTWRFWDTFYIGTFFLLFLIYPYLNRKRKIQDYLAVAS